MKHRVGFNPLGRKTSHRKALHRNMVTSLFKYERITTTKAKARAIRRTAEKMITRAKVDSVHNRRTIAESIWDKAILAKLFTDIGPRFESRPGGYTRMLKIGTRQNDAAEMVILELVGNEPDAPTEKKKKSKSAKSDSPKSKVEKPKAEKPKAEKPAVEEKPLDETASETSSVDESSIAAEEKGLEVPAVPPVAEDAVLSEPESEEAEDSAEKSDS
ncbi:MAG: 50S ribosomal protein L17 [Spirochaetaceae bacterium]|nr:MAG: 50S ribosomal protein L17 [Spirochaetaceae bacterium]